MTQHFAILGDPVEHSLSPQLHQAVFEELGIDAKYHRYLCPPENLEQAAEKLKKGEFQGYSVTIPHKQKLLRFADEMSERVQKLQAANTFLRREDGSIFAENTDYLGFRKSLEEKGMLEGVNKKALVLGSGGAAQAIIAVLQDLSFEITIASRSTKEGTVSYQELDPSDDWSLIVNTTPVGMAHSGFEEEILLKEDAWYQADRTFADIVYNPLITPFLQKAQDSGAQIITGDRMFLWQAVEQSKLFLGEKRAENENEIASILEKTLSKCLKKS